MPDHKKIRKHAKKHGVDDAAAQYGYGETMKACADSRLLKNISGGVNIPGAYPGLYATSSNGPMIT